MPQDNKIKIRRGVNSSLPAANTEVGELRYSTDTKELYIDDGTNNVKIGGNPLGFPISTATQTALNLKANLESPALTGIPTAPTASAGTNTTQIATTAFTIANRGDRYLTTSTTSHSLTTGSKTFTVQSGLSYTATQDITIVADVDPVNKHMHGVVTSYSGTTLVVDIQTVNQSGGPYTAWTINVGGLLSSEGALYSANNLSDVANTATALTNIGGVPTSRSISAGTGLTGGGDLSANRTLSVSFGSSAGSVCEGNDARLSNSRTPTAHAASHAATGSDPLTPASINASYALEVRANTVIESDTTLTAGRNIQQQIDSYSAANLNLTLPISEVQNGDTFVVIGRAFAAGDIVIRRQLHDGSGGGPQFETLATVTDGSGQRFTFRATSTTSSGWRLLPVDTHTHNASAITSGTLTHERGGLEADVSAYNGLVKISGGSTSAVGIGTGSTEVAAGDHAHGNITNGGLVGTTSGLPLKTGTGGIVEAGAFGTTSGTFAAGDDSRITGAAQKSANLSDLASASTARTNLGLGTAATAATGDFAAASHSHELTALAATGATNGHVLTANGSNGATFAALPASGVTGAAASASDVLGVSGANITGVDANADRIVYWNNTSNKLAYGTPADAGAAAASHTHTSADINSQTASNGHVLTANGSGGASFAALPASGISNVDSTLADVMSVSGSNLVADDGGLVDSSNPALVWDDAAGKAVWANPLRRTAAGAFYVGLAPTTTALGTRAINIQADRSLAADRVAQGADCVVIGNSAQTGNVSGATAIGFRARANNTYAVCIGGESVASGNLAIAIGEAVNATQQSAIAIGGYTAGGDATAINAVALNQNANLRGQLSTRPFQAVYWGGQTTNNTATILNLDATATNRFTIAANTALAVDILLVARRSDVADKWLVARRFLGIRRDGSNNTSLIGTVQNFGMTDQSGGSPTWSFALTADDTNDALQLEVTGATGETVQWRACAIYRVV